MLPYYRADGTSESLKTINHCPKCFMNSFTQFDAKVKWKMTQMLPWYKTEDIQNYSCMEILILKESGCSGKEQPALLVIGLIGRFQQASRKHTLFEIFHANLSGQMLDFSSELVSIECNQRELHGILQSNEIVYRFSVNISFPPLLSCFISHTFRE